MYRTRRTYITPDMEMAGLLLENPTLLLLLQHMRIDFTVRDGTVETICQENGIPVRLFVAIANLYNGFRASPEMEHQAEELPVLLRYLRNSHEYYKRDMHDEIQGCLVALHREGETAEMSAVEVFFRDYFKEAFEHLRYEDEIAFPYFAHLSDAEAPQPAVLFSVREYRDHHSDIESALDDVRALLLRQVRITGLLSVRRRLLLALHELAFDLHVHSEVEETILLPLVARMEDRSGQE